MEQNTELLKKALAGSLAIIEQDREREIISKRFGLEGEKETLEQIGEALSITRERVRQLEKAILIRLRINAEEGTIQDLAAIEKIIIRNLSEMGRISKVPELAQKIFGRPATPQEEAGLVFIGDISHSLTLLEENDSFYTSIGIADYGTPEKIKERITEIVTIIKRNKTPMTLDQLDNMLNYEHPLYINALASSSKALATLNGLWGLAKWPTVNPRNIRDKIFIILQSENKPMHFNDIAKAISESKFQRKNVTIQAIHNELIKDDRFVLIGRGIYALDTWGYKSGTVSEIICAVLKEAGKPLTREEIVKQVLRARKVKETTILLNLQDKTLFKKVDKNLFTLA